MIEVVLPELIRKKLKEALRRAGSREIGGVLMGEELAAGRFRVVEFSLDEVTGHRAHFVRTAVHHQEALHEFFKKTGYNYKRFNYLGEWHSHPAFPAFPSVTDLASMQDLVEGERGIDFSVLLIVKLNLFRRFAASMTLHRRGINPEMARLSHE